jgi:broad specificity phosphatase PhoE
MTSFLLVRHTAHDFLTRGVIAGRQPGVHLNAVGREKAAQLAESLSILPIEAIYCGPLERARETAEPLARKLDQTLHIAVEFDEIDPGDWTNRTFAELDRLPEWQRWNTFRSSTTPPNGEPMLDVQRRAVGKISVLRDRHRFVAIFSHGDVIRAVVAHFLGLHIDLYARLEIDPGSLSLIELSENWVRVRFVNAMPDGIAGMSAVLHADTNAC